MIVVEVVFHTKVEGFAYVPYVDRSGRSIKDIAADIMKNGFPTMIKGRDTYISGSNIAYIIETKE